MRALVLTISLMAIAVTAAFAADATVQGRYTLTPSGAGFVRLDTQTGQVSECTGAAARDRKSTRLNSSHVVTSRMPSSA